MKHRTGFLDVFFHMEVEAGSGWTILAETEIDLSVRGEAVEYFSLGEPTC
ncbi:MAG: hypothetical protein OJF47_003912 [Nitrospira sp.]|nr:MAG: hypothetical protein OJF47_003912 [Nitrospira sp.]